jgi:Ca2+-binding RTX toxin-like protein
MSFGNQPGQVSFVDVTQSSGITRQGQSWGVTLYDYNNDGLLDLYLNSHQQKSIFSLFVNQGDGTFVDIASQVFPAGAPSGDFHGSIGLDFDNDGVKDLFQVAGGDLGAADDNANKSNRFFFRQGNRLIDRSVELGIDYPLGRGRMPLAFDFNDDGRLDIVYTGPPRPDGRSIPTIFVQNANGSFTDLGRNSGLSTIVPNGTFSVLGDLNGDNRQELIYVSSNPKIRIYDTSSLPLQEITNSLLPSSLLRRVNNIKDITVADFNGDTFQDLLISQQGTGNSGFRLDSNRAGRAKLSVTRTSQGLTFKDAGILSLNFQGDPSLDLPSFFLGTTITASDIFIGSGKRNPSSLVFDLDPANAPDQGRPNFTPGVDRGVYIWFDNASNQWTVETSALAATEFNFLFETQFANPEIAPKGFTPNLNGKPDLLLTYDPDLGRFVDSTEFANLANTRIANRNTVSGDFDNDGDIDLFIVATANTQNLPDVLLENLGDGRFRNIPLAAGAAGETRGIGDAVVVGDYDVDGFLDLFVTNGDVLGFDRPFELDGTNRLFRNQGNGNHSIQIDLEGTLSNRDAVGAKVYITTPDRKRQVREQNGGVHNRGQNFSRLHFGLGDQDVISRIEVIWPNGNRQVFNNVQADRVIKLVQGSRTIDTLFTYEPNTPNFDITGTLGNDKIRGTEFDNVIEGLAGNDDIKGLSGDDRLLGGPGNDVLTGGTGRDTLNGGSGNDRFDYITPGQGGDRIEDFLPGTDEIGISANGFKSGLEEGLLTVDRFVLGSQASDASDRFIYNRSEGRLWFDPDGNGNQRATLIATLDNQANLTASSIRVI